MCIDSISSLQTTVSCYSIQKLSKPDPEMSCWGTLNYFLKFDADRNQLSDTISFAERRCRKKVGSTHLLDVKECEIWDKIVFRNLV